MRSQDFTTRHNQKRRWSIFLCISCLSCSLLIQFSGFVSTGWIYLKGDVYTIHAGLWYRVTCEKGEDCTIQPMINSNKQYNDMLEFQIETSIALAACIAGVASLILHIKYSHSNVTLSSLVGMLASLLSGVLALIASGKMGHKYLHQHYEQMGSYGKSVYKIPYSAVLTGVGGLIACFVTLVLIAEAHILSKQIQKELSFTGNKAIKYNPSLHTVSTGTAQSDQNLNTNTSHMADRRLSSSMSSGSIGSRQVTTHATEKEMFPCKTVSATVCAGTVVNVTNHVGPVFDAKKPDDENQAGIKDLSSNVVLENGQHVVMNEIYNM